MTINIAVQRLVLGETRTVGTLSINGVPECRTLEDKVRERRGEPVENWKVPKHTAIPEGRYRLELYDSPKHGVDTLQLVGVPGFRNVQIHAGNTEADTDGCILVGISIEKNLTITGGSSRPALAALKAKIVPILKSGEEVWISVLNPA